MGTGVGRCLTSVLLLGPVTGLIGAEPWQSPHVLTKLWDKQTLASFSVSQLQAFAALACGHCPLLSRAVRCTRRSAPNCPSGPKPPESWKHQAFAYLREEAALSQRQVRAMMRHVWSNYEQRAFGKDELKPISGRGTDSWGGLGQTLVDSLDTLWLMGFHEEFNRAADWVESHLDFNKNLNVNYFETSIRHLGGLVSAFVLSSRPGLLGKATDLAGRLAPIFPSPRSDMSRMDISLSELTSAGKLQEWFDGAKRFLHQVFADIAEEFSFGEYADFDLGNLGLGAEDPSGHFANDDKNARKDLTVLPLSDINLQTGKANDLAGYLSLAESCMAYSACVAGPCSTVTSMPPADINVSSRQGNLRTARVESAGAPHFQLQLCGAPRPGRARVMTL